MNDSSNRIDAMDDDGDELALLLAGEVLGDLTDAERRRLRELVPSSNTVNRSTESIRRVAASIGLAAELTRNDLPTMGAGKKMSLNPKLVATIRSDALKHLDTDSSEDMVTIASHPPQVPAAKPWLGWCVAAGLALVCGGLWFGEDRRSIDSPVATFANQAEIESWLAAHPGAIELDWTVKDSSLIVGGEETSTDARELGGLAWDSLSQTGFMRLKALPINDVAVQQYQLWIIDPQRDENPIDGGVFDIIAAGESFVPIVAKLNVIDPIGFAITIEKPGGVVVSDQSRLPLLALVD